MENGEHGAEDSTAAGEDAEQGKHDELAFLHLDRIFPQNREEGNNYGADTLHCSMFRLHSRSIIR